MLCTLQYFRTGRLIPPLGDCHLNGFMVRVHRDKLFMALALLAENRTVREIARKLGLSYTQLKELRKKALPTYLEATEAAEWLAKARDVFIQVASDYEEKLESRRSRLVEEVRVLKRLKNIASLELDKLYGGVVARLKLLKDTVNNLLEEIDRSAGQPWLVHEELHALRETLRAEGLATYALGPRYTCISNEAEAFFDKADRVIKGVVEELRTLNRLLEEVLKKLTKSIDSTR